MGFMTGAGAFSESFGKAFSNSYGRTQEIKAQRDKDERDLNDDVFKMTLKEQMENKEALRKEKERDRGLIATGQAIADTYNGPADVAVKMLKEGADAQAVKEFFAKGDFRRSEALTLAAPPTSGNNGNATGRNVDSQLPALDEDKAGATQDQMDSVFGPNGSVPSSTAPSPATPNITPSIPSQETAPVVENDLGNGWIRTPKADPTVKTDLKGDYEAALKRGNPEEIARTKALYDKFAADENANRPPPVGRNSFDIQSEIAKKLAAGDKEGAAQLQGVQQQALAAEQQSKTAAQGPQRGVYVTTDGKQKVDILTPVITPDGVVYQTARGETGRPLVEGEQEALDNFAKEVTGPKAQEFRGQVAVLAGAYRSAGRIDEILTNNPNIRANTVGFFRKTVADISNEMEAAADLLNVEMNTNSQTGGYTAESIHALQEKLNGINLSEIKDQDKAASILDAEMAVLVYQAASAKGQTGQAFAKNDQAMISDIIGASASKGETMQQVLANYLDGAKKSLDDSVGSYNQSVTEAYRSNWNYVPMDEPVEGFDKFVTKSAQDPNLLRGIDLSNRATVVKQPNEETPTELPRPSSREEMLKLDPGTSFIDPEGKVRTVPPRKQ